MGTRARCQATTTAWSATWRPRWGRLRMLTEQQKSDLLELARKSIAAQVAGRREPMTLESDLPNSSGAFVTIKRRGELRGCLGTLQCSRGLAREVARCAADAASEDPRFPPVSPDE